MNPLQSIRHMFIRILWSNQLWKTV